ncbi:hypothetical protein BC832DRAFT_548640 [Gaertneriomyces semiglobifer]|nr:hypothetical protein BC832DRAFT_548640 [Gaertneriomyces semiglobifer]
MQLAVVNLKNCLPESATIHPIESHGIQVHETRMTAYCLRESEEGLYLMDVVWEQNLPTTREGIVVAAQEIIEFFATELKVRASRSYYVSYNNLMHNAKMAQS